MTPPLVNVDVTDLVDQRLTSGIQRCVRELTARLVRTERFPVRLLRFDKQRHTYDEVDPASYLAFLADDTDPVLLEPVAIDDLGADDVFFDLDATWNTWLKRPHLYRILKSHGVTLVNLLYDLVPVTVPQYAHPDTVRNWAAYISAIYTYSDLVLPISRSTEADFLDLAEKIGLDRHVPTVVTKLAGDVTRPGAPTAEERRRTEPFADRPYFLFVGTIEPRKSQRLAIEAFEHLWRTHPDAQLVLAGREGWLSEETVRDLRQHPRYGEVLHWVEAPSDALLLHLYEQAHGCVYLSSYEGFGLPVAESLQHGKVTVTSRGSSLYEVGTELADYTFFDSAEEVARTVATYLDHPELRTAREQAIRDGYTAYTWDGVYRIVEDAVAGIGAGEAIRSRPRPDDLPFVFISNAPEKVRSTVAQLDERASFVREYVVVCPSSQIADMQAIPSKHRVHVVPEEELLGDRLAEFRAAGHQRKNWMLRASLAGLDRLGDEFVMLDDDNRPLRDLRLDDFIGEDRRYRAYFYYDLPRWPHHVSDYDRGQHTTHRVLDAAGLELLSYSSHQPQVVNRALFAEAVAFVERTAPGAGVDEWSTYFDHAVARYPTLFAKRPFRTMNWPADPADWTHRYRPGPYLFENFYPELYAAGLFEGLAEDDTEGKLAAKAAQEALFDRSRAIYRQASAYVGELGLVQGPLVFRDDTVTVVVSGLPSLVTMADHSAVRVEFSVQVLGGGTTASLELGYQLFGGHRQTVPLVGPPDQPLGYLARLGDIPFLVGDPGVQQLEYLVLRDGVEVPCTGPRPTATLVVVGPDQTPAQAYAALPSDGAFRDLVAIASREPEPVPPTVPLTPVLPRRSGLLRRAAKKVVARVLPGLPAERARFHEMSDRMSALPGRLEQLQRSLDAAETRLRRLESPPAEPEPPSRLDEVRALLAKVEPYQPAYGIAGLVEDPRRETADRADALTRGLGEVRGLRVLDAGCGLGYVAFHLADRGAVVTGWDSNPDNIAAARAIGALTGVPVDLRTRTLDAVSVAALDPSAYDVVLLLSVLHHVVAADGLTAAQELVRDLVERTPRVVVELASGGEDPFLPWADAQPDDPREVLALVRDRVEVTELGTFPTHLSDRPRPLLLLTRDRVVEVNGTAYPYETVRTEAYPGSPLLQLEGSERRYYLGRDHVVKEVRWTAPDAERFRQAVREVATYVDLLADRDVFHRPTLLDVDLGHRAAPSRLVLRRAPGSLLCELAPLPPVSLEAVARDLLHTLDDLQAAGIGHHDVRSWNVVVGPEGAWLIDYGLAGRDPVEDDAVALLWTLHAGLTGRRESIEMAKTHLPPREDLPEGSLRSLYDAVAGGERSFSVLRATVG